MMMLESFFLHETDRLELRLAMVIFLYRIILILSMPGSKLQLTSASFPKLVSVLFLSVMLLFMLPFKPFPRPSDGKYKLFIGVVNSL
jgi:amino acid permease